MLAFSTRSCMLASFGPRGQGKTVRQCCAQTGQLSACRLLPAAGRGGQHSFGEVAAALCKAGSGLQAGLSACSGRRLQAWGKAEDASALCIALRPRHSAQGITLLRCDQDRGSAMLQLGSSISQLPSMPLDSYARQGPGQHHTGRSAFCLLKQQR